MNKKILALVLGTVLIVGVLAGCGSKQAATKAKETTTVAAKEVTLTVGAALVPHAEILNFAKPLLKAQGINLVVKTLDDEAQLNPALDEKQIDANYFQHVPYLDSVVKEKGYKFANVGKIHVEPIGFYSQKIKTIGELKVGATIGIPNNPSNEYRALALLQLKGLIKLKTGIANYSATPKDIVENPKKLKFQEVDVAQLPRVLPDIDGAIINTNIILDAKIDPKSAIFREDENSPYANIIVVRQGDESRPEIKTFVKVLQSAEVKKFIKDKYGVAVVPAF
ncbi:MetQ/NlpA family ABC transporter substrate-binding protein [Clostridium estertheticum]|uniref:Lipoprotein n=1 Tax=Clostridium estertheticum TaxID=238834 RepID=A0AA47I916_9CLOT|nr:MetQ/NlpA family ABC transporter substrate-binding protein [Clostridium estertheticum]MBU3154547.1 MetQ/NlpA family ABC transporter substrate-binding protein [Clostridium estertheticum]MBU3201239.1 MetQ/NlpA family ABC transporter substrate-binding protein [Clostridium estertheticum]WAG62019.1 MetQ/NlpA family ABC transporter substrate-binding protein [Clostridium estertheticum]WAG63857.1 MetQ/NlpA family ABC transporter substrate-binding protein [Clostridium estertheticum]